MGAKHGEMIMVVSIENNSLQCPWYISIRSGILTVTDLLVKQKIPPQNPFNEERNLV